MVSLTEKPCRFTLAGLFSFSADGLERHHGNQRGGAEPDSEGLCAQPTLSYQAMESPRHKVQISENVVRMFREKSLAELKRDPGDE